jgi:DNA-directed RNA polymerase sigma subunit (sigma70/sigma32)
MGVKAELIEKLKKIRTQTICSLSDPVNSQNDESESSREYFIADTRAKSPEAETVKINGEKFWLSVSRILGCNGNGKIVLEIINQRNLFTTKEERELGKRKKSLKEVLDEMNIPNLNLQERSFYIEVMRRIGFTLEDLGEEFAITRERIRQIGSSNERKLGTEKSKAELRQYR